VRPPARRRVDAAAAPEIHTPGWGDSAGHGTGLTRGPGPSSAGAAAPQHPSQAASPPQGRSPPHRGNIIAPAGAARSVDRPHPRGARGLARHLRLSPRPRRAHAGPWPGDRARHRRAADGARAWLGSPDGPAGGFPPGPGRSARCPIIVRPSAGYSTVRVVIVVMRPDGSDRRAGRAGVHRRQNSAAPWPHRDVLAGPHHARGARRVLPTPSLRNRSPTGSRLPRCCRRAACHRSPPRRRMAAPVRR
jgi:hypothetical protein